MTVGEATDAPVREVVLGPHGEAGRGGWLLVPRWCWNYGEYGTESGGGVFVTPAPEWPWPLRADVFSSFRAGFDIRTRRLCRRVLMVRCFTELDPQPTLGRSTDLTYDES